jgi:hypothetical protein
VVSGAGSDGPQGGRNAISREGESHGARTAG